MGAMNTPDSRPERALHLFLIISLLLIAFLLRSYHLTFHPLWWDEGLTLAFAPLNYLENARLAIASADINPPIYRLMIGAWSAIVGSSAFTTRLYSVFCGLLVTAGTYRLVRTLRMGVHTALLAILLAVFSPILIYYSQEAKGYMQESMAAMGLFTLWWRYHQTLQQQNILRWLLFAVLVVLGIGAHYLFLFLLIVLNLYSFWMLRKDWQTATTRPQAIQHVLWQILAQVVAGLVLLPFFWLTYSQTRTVLSGDIGDPANYLNGALEFFGRHAVEFAFGPFAGFPANCTPQLQNQLCALVYGSHWLPGMVVFALMLVCVAVQLWFWRKRRSVILSLAVFVPLALGYFFNAVQTFFFPRFLLYSVPFLLILVAGGLNTLARLPGKGWRWIGLAVVGLYALACVPVLHRFYTTPTTAAEDWRPALAQAAPWVQNGDGVLHEYVWAAGYAHAYWQSTTHATLAHFHQAERAAQIDQLLQKYPRLWLLQYQVAISDPNASNARYLLQNSALAMAVTENTADVGLFLAPNSALNYQSAPPTATNPFANGVQVQFAPVNALAKAGDAIAVQVFWQVPEALAPEPHIFLHLVNAAGEVATQQDGLPHNNATTWQALSGLPAQADYRALLLPADLPTGTYSLHLGLYDPTSGQRIPTQDGAEFVVLGTVTLK
jgi:hypothetical protein